MRRFYSLMLIITLANSLNNKAIGGTDEYVYSISTDRSSIAIANGTITIAGGQIVDTPGVPAVGYRIIKLALPPGTEITSFSCETSDPLILGSFDIDFARGDLKTGNYPADTASAPDPGIYDTDEIFPEERARLLGDGNWGDIHVADFAVYPIGYRPLSGQILFYPEITARISLAPSPGGGRADARSDPHAYRELSQIVSNRDDLIFMASPPFDDPPMTTSLPSPEYLIITSGQVAPGFYPFLLWKNQKGVPTDMVLIEDILATTAGDDPAEKLRNYLIEAYNNGVQYVLLGGHQDIVPIRYLYPGNVNDYVPELTLQHISDLYFADLTGVWDADGDGVWGESYHDQPDIYPELYVGRVPASSAEQASVWSHKAILYETNPGNGDPSYLTKALFISADQMRDLGQQDVLAAMMPGNFTVDATRLIEQPSGIDPSPTSPAAEYVIEVMQEGWGLVSNLNHGDYSWYSSKGARYNSHGWSGVWGDTVAWEGCGALSHLTTYDKPAVHYSISCDLAALDFDTGIFRPPPYPSPYCYAESDLFEPGAAVAFLGNTRWGWVSSSYNLERRFLIHLLEDSTCVLSVAEALSKIDYPNYRDIGYGHNLFGDPETSFWLSVDGNLSVDGPTELDVGRAQQIQYSVSSGSDRVSGARVCLYTAGEIFEVAVTDNAGHAQFSIEPQNDGYLTITATMPRYIPSQITALIGTPAGLDDEPELPGLPALSQNFPNPFNPNTTIEFYLPARARADLDIFDITGRLVKRLASGEFPAGSNRITWNGKDNSGQEISSGIYFYKFSTGSTVSVKQMTFIK